MTANHTQTHFDLRDAFNEQGCPLCRLGLAAVDRWMTAVDYESVGDPGLRARLRAAHGFCNRHAHQWLAHAHVLGTAQIYQDILAGVTETLRSLRSGREPAFGGLAAVLAPSLDRHGLAGLEPSGRCPACQVLAEREATLASTLVTGLAEVSFREAYRASTGACLPHLALALAHADDEAVFTTLRDAAIDKQNGLLADLAKVIRRHDYRFAAEPWGQERDAAARAVDQTVGASGIAGRQEIVERGWRHAGRQP